jgi:hypothetical protein
MSAEAQAMRTLEEIAAAIHATGSRFALSEAEEISNLNTISHCLESLWLSYARSRAFPDAPRDDFAIGHIMRSQDVEVLRDVNSHLFGEIVRMFPHMADSPKAAALLRCYASLIRVLEQVDDSAHEEFSSIARALMPATRSANNPVHAHQCRLAAVLFTCVSGSESILEELYAAGYFTLFLTRLSFLAHSLPPSIKFILPADKRAALHADSWAYLELESLLIMCDALSDLVQTSEAVSLLLRTSASSASAAVLSSAPSASSASLHATSAAAAPAQSSSAGAATAASPLAAETDALSFCFALCAFEDRDIACYSIMILQSIVSHPRVSTAFMDRRGPDVILPLALPQAGAAHPWTYFTGPFCALMCRCACSPCFWTDPGM